MTNGLTFALPPKCLRKTDVIVTFEMINFLQSNLKSDRNTVAVKSQLSYLANGYISGYKPSLNVLKKHGILKKLRLKKDIVILKPDKGNGVVILNRTDYVNQVLGIINDTSKFKTLDEDPTIKREGQLQRYIRKLKNGNIINERVYDKIYPKGSLPARIYGLPKIHKKFDRIPSFRPVVSSIGTFNYYLAQFLGGLLTPLLLMEYTAKDTFTFIDQIKQVSSSGKFMISFDVASLFTNIPLKEVTNLAVKLILGKHLNNKFSEKHLTRLFEFATLRTNFQFDEQMYDQVDGVAMGSPLAPILANLFMGHHEKNWIDSYGGPKPSFYRRYVDDIFCIFDNENQALNFLEYLNQQHPNIKFTFEKEVNQTLPFLDILIDNSSDDIITSVFHKPTYTGLLTNFNSFIPLKYKIGLIKAILDRTFRISSSWQLFDIELRRLSYTLNRNFYPSWLIDKVVRTYLNNAYNRTVTEMNIKSPELRCFKLPFVGNNSKVLQDRIKNIISKHCKDIDVRMVFTTSKLRDFFSAKDKLVSFSHTSRVVYEFICANCKASYIGETERNLSVRIDEHLFSDKKSHVYKHLSTSEDCKRMGNALCFSVLDRGNTKHQLRIKEGLHIKWRQPVLNKQLYCYVGKLMV